MKHKPLSLITTALLFFCTLTGYTQDYWNPINTPSGVNILSLATTADGTIFIGTYYNSDGKGIYRLMPDSTSWELVGLSNYSTHSFGTTQAGEIFAGVNDKIFKSSDNGDTWIEKCNTDGNVLCITPGENGVLFASCWGNTSTIQRSTDDGETWSEVFNTGDNSEPVESIAILNTDTIYAGTTNFFEGGGMIQSVDAGMTWDTIGLYNFQVTSVAINSKGDVFVGTYGHNIQYWLSGVYVKYHNQNNWVKKASGYITKILINKYDDIFVALGGGVGGQVIVSKDNGDSFQLLNGVFPDEVSCLSLDGAGYLYAASSNPAYLAKSLESTTIITLDGSVTYANAGATPLASITVELAKEDSIVRDTLTNAQGYYLFRGIDTGVYTMNVTSHKSWGGVSAADVLLYRKHIANISSLNGIYLASGDVNGSGDLTAVDILLIKKRIANIITTFPTGDWFFNNQPVTVNGRVTYNFKGICYGDANGSYVPQ